MCDRVALQWMNSDLLTNTKIKVKTECSFFFLSFIQFINKFVTNFHHRKHFFTDKFKRKILLKI